MQALANAALRSMLTILFMVRLGLDLLSITDAVGQTNLVCHAWNVSCPPEHGCSTLRLSFLNNSTANTSLTVYVTGQDENGLLKVLDPSGRWIYPEAPSQLVPTPLPGNLSISIGETQTITDVLMPGPLFAGRIWVARGPWQLATILGSDNRTTLVPPSPAALSSDLNSTSWAFVELTYDQTDGFWANLSYVDFVGLLLRLTLEDSDGANQHAYGLESGTLDGICRSLANQSVRDGQPWDQLCGYDGDRRPSVVVSPNTFISTNPSAFADYWTAYIDEVWAKYENEPLSIDTQGPMGVLNCTVKGDELWCQDESFARPSTADVFSCCSGPFAPAPSDSLLRRAIVARLCAAINRSTLMLGDGNWQPSSNASAFYTADPTNYYSKLVHQHEVESLGYAFPYDDVSGEQDENPANVLSSPTAQALTIVIEDHEAR